MSAEKIPQSFEQWLARLFGDAEGKYGVRGYTLPEGWWPQFLWPFRRAQKPLKQGSS